jgi:AraC-like DNA-binding protein
MRRGTSGEGVQSLLRAPEADGAVELDNTYPLYPLGLRGHIYTSRNLQRGFTSRPLGVVLLSADHSPFEICLRGQEPILTTAVAIAPSIERRVHGVGVPVLSFNIYPPHPTFRAFAAMRRSGLAVLARHAFAELDPLLEKLVDSAASTSKARLVFEAVVACAAEQLPAPPQADPRVADMVARLDGNPMMTLDELAALYRQTPRNVSRTFSAGAGMSIRDYKDFTRAKQLALRLCSKESLTQVAFAAGYNGSPELSNSYRRWYGQSPSSMRDPRQVKIHRAAGEGEQQQ